MWPILPCPLSVDTSCRTKSTRPGPRTHAHIYGNFDNIPQKQYNVMLSVVYIYIYIYKVYHRLRKAENDDRWSNRTSCQILLENDWHTPWYSNIAAHAMHRRASVPVIILIENAVEL